MNLIQVVKKIARSCGFEISRFKTGESFSPDVEPAFVDIYQKVQPFTMTSPERIFSLCAAVKYVVDKRIEGDIVECGVWKGGSMMAVAETLLLNNNQTRDLYLFDTFEGMSSPTNIDVDIAGVPAVDLLAKSDKQMEESVWCCAAIDAVKAALGSTRYPASKLYFIKGMVEQTIPQNAPDKIAILRLDTDWYESTKHEMNHLFPRLVKGGVLIIDDYGHWQGARKAVDEYLEKNDIKIFLNRIDYTGRIAVKVD